MPRDQEIKYALTLSLDQFNRGVRLASGKVDRMGRDIKRSLKGTTAAFGGLAKSIALVGAAGAAAAAGGLLLFRRELSKAVALASVQENAEIRLAGVLRATGEAAGFSLQEIKAYASELQNITTVGDEVILSNAAVLLSFKNIKGDQFKEALKAAVDLSAVTGRDLKTSIEQVGKALNDPARGVTRLQTIGVAFTKQQRELIKTLQETGDVAGAQNIVLDALKSRYGDVANALRGTFSGAVQSAKNAFGDLQEQIGFTVTKNAFFLESAKVIEELFKSWSGAIKANQGEWMVWSKEAALAVLEFAADFADGINSVYKGLQKMSGVLKLALAGTVKLGQGFQRLFELSNRFVGNTDKAEYWAQAQKDSAELVEEAMAGAAEAFDNADRGLPFLETTANKIRELKTELARIEPEFRDVADGLTSETREYDQQVEKIGDTYVTVYDEATRASNRATAVMINNARQVSREINAASYTRREGGAIGLNRGGRLSGWGGGDIIPALLEPGEWVIRKEAVNRYGHAFFDMLNSMSFPRFQAGGAVGATSSQEIVLRLADTGRSARVYADEQNKRDLIDIISDLGYQRS